MIFPTTVNGIPCKCQVTHFLPAVPMKVYGPGMGDADPPEEEEFDFKLLDRRGRRATWLDRYISPSVQGRLSEEAHIMRQAEYFA
jgi:hypothetical protein